MAGLDELAAARLLVGGRSFLKKRLVGFFGAGLITVVVVCTSTFPETESAKMVDSGTIRQLVSTRL